MQNVEAQELLLQILEQAQEGKVTEFHLIMTMSECKFYYRRYRADKLIIRTLKSAAKRLYKTYCKEVRIGTADAGKLFAYVQLQEVINFYTRDLTTIKQMLSEYDEYLGQGNFWYSFLGGERR